MKSTRLGDSAVCVTEFQLYGGQGQAVIRHVMFTLRWRSVRHLRHRVTTGARGTKQARLPISFPLTATPFSFL
jgi:hypothetical protein